MEGRELYEESSQQSNMVQQSSSSIFSEGITYEQLWKTFTQFKNKLIKDRIRQQNTHEKLIQTLQNDIFSLLHQNCTQQSSISRQEIRGNQLTENLNLQQIKEEYKIEIKSLKEEHAKALHLEREDHKKQREIDKQEYKNEIKQLKKEHQKALQEQKVEHDRVVQIMWDEYKKVIQNLEDQLKTFKTQNQTPQGTQQEAAFEIGIQQFQQMAKKGDISNIILNTGLTTNISGDHAIVEVNKPTKFNQIRVIGSQVKILYIRSIYNITFENCTFEGIGLGIWTTQQAILKQININKVQCGYDALSIRCCKNVFMKSIQIMDIGRSGCYLYSCKFVEMDQVGIKNCDKEAVSIDSSKVSLKGCFFDNCATGIYLINGSKIWYESWHMFGVDIQQKVVEVSENQD
eukprot:TRINITY_DN159093_c0_g1_i1.p2 TRINITY_DN159093_c0_g1~~TRINITY_DN159093_c0_g1_i1.p2  ORF type:complete len:402 (-),score=40.66 TRINITY_DN159093_c0_g1_i1:194-1399(-)